MQKRTARTAVATLVATVLTAGVVAVPTASACPLDPYDNCLVVAPDTQKTPAKPKKAKKTKKSAPLVAAAHGGGR
jgi:hypothetical protein